MDEDIDACCGREAKVVRLIRAAFDRLGLKIADVFYQEDCDREAAVTLYDDTVDLCQLSRLMTSGLAETYRVWGTCHPSADIWDRPEGELHVVFQVSSDLDDAVDG